MNEKETENFLPWKQIVNFKDKTWSDESILLFKLYTRIPPRRIKDYQLMKYVKGKSLETVKEMSKKWNYVVLSKNKYPQYLVYNNYKTRKIYGQFIVDLTNPDQKPNFIYSEIRKAGKNAFESSGAKSMELIFPSAKGNVIKDFTRAYLYYIFNGTGKFG